MLGTIDERGLVGALRPLHLAGVDVMLDVDGKPHLVEINDRPLCLSRVAVSSLRGPSPERTSGSNVAAALARELVAVGSGRVAIVLPEVFALDSGAKAIISCPVDWQQVDVETHADARVEPTLADLTAFTNAAVAQGGTVTVIDARCVAASGVLDPTIAVWNRSQIDVPGCPLRVNRRAAARYCLDKLLARQVCAAVDPTISTQVADPDDVPVVPGWSADGYLVVKPRFGSGSRDVWRGTWPRLRSMLRDRLADEQFVVEPWIDSACVVTDARPYRFDLRIYVLGGRAVGALARRAAAPASAPFDDSPLSWLTTTGSVLSTKGVEATRATADSRAMSLPSRWLAASATLAEAAVDAVQVAVADEGSEAPPPGDGVSAFQAIHGLRGELRRITLRASPAERRAG